MAKSPSTSQAGMNKPRALDKLPSATAGLQPIKWADLPPEQRREYLERTLDDYESLIREIVDSSNRCVVKCEQFMRANSLWRWIVIVSTGTIALVNILAGHLNSQVPPSKWATDVSVGASIFAVMVTIVATLEGFTNAAERAQGYRESREMFVDVRRDFAAAWEDYVSPLRDSPEACANAAELHRRLIAADQELRARFKNLTMARQEHGGKTP
jgi:hypothetical protein